MTEPREPCPQSELPESRASREEERHDRMERRQVELRRLPSEHTLHDVLIHQGCQELDRATSAIFWSALAAGLSMGFSLVAEGVLYAHLPEVSWRPLVAGAGYSVGFVIVIFGRQLLFTENTLTPVLPLLRRREAATLVGVLRLWAVVLGANLLGAVLIAWALSGTGVMSQPVREAFEVIGQEAMVPGFWSKVWRGVFAGWLIALIVWILPYAEVTRLWVVILLTWLVSVAGLTHVIAGSIEVFTLAWSGQAGWFEVLGGYTLPALIGNTIGGVTLVAALNHGQVVSGEHNRTDGAKRHCD